MSWKTQHKNFTKFQYPIDKAEEKILGTEDQLNEIKQEGKNREKRVKTNEQSLQEIWDYVKRPNLCLIGNRNMMEKMNPS